MDAIAHQQERLLSIYEIEVLLWYFRSNEEDHPDMSEGTDAWKKARDHLKEVGLLRERDCDARGRVYHLTERSDFYIRDGLLQVPLPVPVWKFPRKVHGDSA